jgi:hypothetical protein
VIAFVAEQKTCCELVVVDRANDDVRMHAQVPAGDGHDPDLRGYRFARRLSDSPDTHLIYQS